MCHAVLQDPEFFLLLLQIDQQIADEAREARCGRCGAALHSACYPRKPRGCPAKVREQYASRFSFCCSRCDRRTTPASVRFLGRRVYVAVMLMLVSPPGGTAGRAVCDVLSDQHAGGLLHLHQARCAHHLILADLAVKATRSRPAASRGSQLR